MNANLEASYTIPESLSPEQEFEMKQFLHSTLMDAVAAKIPLKISAHRYMIDANHQDDEFCECGVVEITIPNDPNVDVDDLFKEYLILCKSIH